MRPLFLAIQFLTPFPVGEVREVEEEDLRKTVAFFPFVGILQGFILYISIFVLNYFSPHMLTSGLVLLIWVVITGGFHLDGLADTVDGLAGGRDKEDVLRIMKRGDTGPFGVIAISMTLLLKYLSIDYLISSNSSSIVFLAPLMGKVGIVLLNSGSQYGREEGGLGRAFVDGVDAGSLSTNITVAIILLLIFAGYRGLLIFIILGMVIHLIRSYLHRRIGGVTGDNMGAVAEITEILFLTGMAGFTG